MITCQHCGAAVPDEEARDGWCEACGKKLPASAVAAIRPPVRRERPPEPPQAVQPEPSRPAPSRPGSPPASAAVPVRPDVLIREQFRPVQACLIAVCFPPVGALVGLMGAGGLRGNGWGAVAFGVVLLVIATAFVLIALLHAAMLFRRVVYGKGPVVIAVREDGLTDNRTAPPTVTAWAEIDDVDVVYQSEGARVNEKRVILFLRGGGRREVDLRELDISTWKLKEVIRTRLNDLRRAASPPLDAAVSLGAVVASFPSRHGLLDVGVLLLALPAFGIALGATLALVGVTAKFTQTRRDDVIFLAFGVTLLGACAGYFLRRDRLFRDRIQVYERGLLVRGLVFTRSYFFAQVGGAVLLSKEMLPVAVVLKRYGGRDVKLHTPPGHLGELYRLINARC